MKYLTLAVGAVIGLAACQDTTSPPAEPADISPAGTQPEASITAQTFPSLWAKVNLNGSLAGGSRVISAVRLGAGRYEVTFSRNVSTCAYLATTRNAYSQAIQASTAGGHLSANGVYVETKNQGGGLTDGPFDLVATCGTQQGIRFAVVGYTGNLVRATPGTILQSPGVGRYNVVFPTSVAGCAYIATLADPGNGLVFSPSGVYTGSGPNANTVYIETKNPGGGLQPGVPFHLGVVCRSSRNAAFAVVRSNGTLRRGSLNTFSARIGIGQYQISAIRPLAACAAVATRGSVNTGVPFSPATVEIVPGPNANSFGVQVRQLLFFGGNLSDQAFHAAAIC
jgi:hypothetical protein